MSGIELRSFLDQCDEYSSRWICIVRKLECNYELGPGVRFGYRGGYVVIASAQCLGSEANMDVIVEVESHGDSASVSRY